MARLARSPRLGATLLIAALALGAGTACGSSTDSGDAPRPVATTTVPAPELRVLVTNDDGVGAPGIAALVQGLQDLPATEVTVVAPAGNRSGSGSRTTAGRIEGQAATTANGATATAVEGFPADAVNFALDTTPRSAWPHVVISGINEGQNLGVVIDVSGTVGAARTAATRGVPALAVSQGLGPVPDYPAGVRAALAWLKGHRAALLARPVGDGDASVTNLNVPTCPFGTPRPVVIVPPDPTANGIAPVDCTATFPAPTTDVEAFTRGYITRTDDLRPPKA